MSAGYSNDLRRDIRLLRERIAAIEATATGLQAQQDAAEHEADQEQGSAVTLADLPAEPLAAAAEAGKIDEASRRDHRHPFPTAAEVGADPAGTAAAAVAAHEALSDPHPQYASRSVVPGGITITIPDGHNLLVVSDLGLDVVGDLNLDGDLVEIAA